MFENGLFYGSGILGGGCIEGHGLFIGRLLCKVTDGGSSGCGSHGESNCESQERERNGSGQANEERLFGLFLGGSCSCFSSSLRGCLLSVHCQNIMILPSRAMRLTFRYSVLPPNAFAKIAPRNCYVGFRRTYYTREISSGRRHRAPSAKAGNMSASGRPCGRIHGLHTQEPLDRAGRALLLWGDVAVSERRLGPAHLAAALGPRGF